MNLSVQSFHLKKNSTCFAVMQENILNPQLRSITKFDDLQFFTQYLGSIENLHRYHSDKFWGVRCIQFPSLMKRLMELKLGWDFEWNKSFYEFIKEYKSIEKITFECENLLSPEDNIKVAKALPSLQTIDIFPCAFRQISTIDTITSYLSIFKNLKCLRFKSLDVSTSEIGVRHRYSQE